MTNTQQIQQRIQWFLDFMGLDFEKLTPSDQLKWFIDACIKVRPDLANNSITDFVSLHDAGSFKRSQKVLINFFDILIGAHADTGLVNSGHGVKITDCTCQVRADSAGNFQLFAHTGDIADELLFLFMKTLEGVPSDAFFQCPECKCWFFHSGKRTKKFCSNPCSAKYINRMKYHRGKE